MRIRFTDLYETVGIQLPHLNYFANLKRCVWYDVSEEVGNELLKSDYFIREEELDFERTLSKTSLEKIALHRFGALGDLLMLVPIARKFKQKYNVSLTLVTQKCYIDIMKFFPDVFDVVIPQGAFDRRMFSRVLYLDGLLEVDHSLTNREREIHRCQLYADFFTVDTKDLDWSIKIPKEEEVCLSTFQNSPK